MGGITRTPTSDLDLDRNRVLRANRAAWSARLRELAPIDELAAYVWLAFTCGATESRDLTLDEIVEPASTFKDAPIIGFKRAICRGIETEALLALRDHDPRFGEVPYYLGLFAVVRWSSSPRRCMPCSARSAPSPTSGATSRRSPRPTS